MKLLQIALAGLVGLAGLTAATDHKWYLNHLKARGERNASWDNDGAHTYLCSGQVKISECDIYGNNCVTAGICYDHCEDTGHGAICVDPVKAVKVRGESDIAWDNDGSGKYICSGLNMQRCGLDGSACSWVEYCADGCFDTGHGALCVNRATLRVRKLVEGSKPKPVYDYNNGAQVTYECSRNDVVRCPHQNDHARCTEKVATCDKGCEQSPGGVNCKKSSLKLRNNLDPASVSNPQSKCDGVSGKCRECTDTRRGIYSCNSGFCAVEPGDWCKSGWSCHDDCTCCKKDGKGGKGEVGSHESTPKVRSMLKREFVVPTQVLDTPYGPCPSDQLGHTSCRDNNSVIVICDPADLFWRAVGKCAGSDHCCESRRDNPNAAQCKCKAGLTSTLEYIQCFSSH